MEVLEKSCRTYSTPPTCATLSFSGKQKLKTKNPEILQNRTPGFKLN